MLQILEKCHRI